MTGLNAKKAGIHDRGLITPGMWADLLLIDMDMLKDDPSYEHPVTKCSGIDCVWVNGVLTIENGTHTGARAGKILRK